MTGGDETVPTVRMGDRSLVNPSPGRLIDEIRKFDPSLIGTADASARARKPLRIAQWVVISALIVISIFADALGHSALSSSIDAIAITTYFSFRSLRIRALGRGRVDGINE